MLKNIDVFEKLPVPKAVLKLALPTVLSMLVAVFYNMVDTFFVGQIGDPNQVAAVSVATPVFLFLMAFGNIFGIGGSAFLSRSLGEKNFERVKSISSFCFYAGIAVGVIGGILLFIFADPILSACGTSEFTIGFARNYLRWVAIGGPAIVISTAYTNLIRGEGDAKASMFGMMAGTIGNIVLDPVFILPNLGPVPCFGLGVAGAAIATVIGNLITVVVYMFHVTSKKSVLTISPSHFTLKNHIPSGVFAIGLPASITNILMSLSNIVMNKLLVSYGDVNVAGMGIAMKANMLTVFIMLGIGIGIQPLIGYNFGAKNFGRLKAVMKFAMLLNFVSGSVLTVVYFIFSEKIISVFISDASVITSGAMMLRALMTSMPVLGLLFIFNFTFQAMGKAKESLLLAVSRQGLVFLPVIFILRLILGLNGLIFAQPIADYFSVMTALIMFFRINRAFKTQEKIQESFSHE